MPKRLLLIPTSMERDQLLSQMNEDFSKQWEVRLCGFGVIAAATMTTRWIQKIQPDEVLLAGIAGTFDRTNLNDSLCPVGSAVWFSEVICDGIGVSAGDGSNLSAAELGWNQIESFDDATSHVAIGDRIALTSQGNHTSRLLTVCAASGSLEIARERRQKYGSNIAAEDMEGYAVAMACQVAGVRLRIVRGISNVAGDRDSANWQMDAALKSVAEAIQSSD